MNYIYQSTDSVTKAVYRWTSSVPDPLGSLYPGPNAPTDVIQVNDPKALASASSAGLMTAAQVTQLSSTAQQVFTGSLESSYEVMIDTILRAAPTKIFNVYVGDNITGTSTVTTIPGVLPGVAALTAAGTASGFSIKTDGSTGRKCWYSATSEDRALILSAGVFKDVIVVYRNYGVAAPPVNAAYLCSMTNGVYPLQLNANKDHWEVSGVGNPVHYLDGVQNNSLCNDERPHVYEGVISGNSATGLKVGGFDGYSAPFSVRGEIFAVIPFTSELTAGERATITNAIKRYYKITSPTALFIDGNSIAAGFPNMDFWIRYVVMPNVTTWNIAHSGDNLNDVIDSLSSGFASKDHSNLNKIYFLYEDVNSLNARIDSVETILAKNWQIAKSARALGFKVILSTCMPASVIITGDAETKRLAVNAAKRVQWQDHCDALIDWASIPPFTVSDPPVFADHLHLTNYGYYLFGACVRDVARSLLA